MHSVASVRGYDSAAAQRAIASSGPACVQPGPRSMLLSCMHAGGSPVQADLIFNLVRRLSKSSGIPVFTFAEDVAASGGYWLM